MNIDGGLYLDFLGENPHSAQRRHVDSQKDSERKLFLNPEMFLMLLSLAHDLADINSQLFLPAFHGVAGVWEASAGAPGETSVKIFWRRD